MSKLPITDEHVQYEKQMLDIIWGSWQPEGWAAMEKLGFDKSTKQALYNIMHESFSVHAQNLVMYFGGDDYFTTHYLNRVDDQILTLTSNRTSVLEEKIQMEDNKRVYEWICKKWNSTCPNLN